MVKVIVNGKTYPCRPTMGALLRFKQETGKEVTEMQGDSISEVCTYLYCCVASASAADKISFDMSLMEFADAMNPDDLTAWAQQLQAPSDTKKAEKKSQPRRKA